MFRNWVIRLFRAPRRRGAIRRRLSNRPLVFETLEDRSVPAVINLLPHVSNATVDGAIFTHLHGISGGGGTQTDTFLSIRSSHTVEEGYNTDAPLDLDTKSPSRAILLSQVPTVNVGDVTYREFMLDINESSNQGHEYLALNDLRVYTAGVSNLSGYNTATGELGGVSPLYDLDALADNTILLDGSGSGAVDMFFLVPESAFGAVDPSTTFVYLYSRMGDTSGLTINDIPPGASPAWFAADDGFEHWSFGRNGPLYPRSDLAVTKTDFQTTAIPGQQIDYTITVTNNGPTTVTSFTFSDTIPPGLLNPVFGNPSAGTLSLSQSGNVFSGIWSGMVLATGQSVTVHLRGTIDPAATGTITNTVSVFTTPGTTDDNLTNNTATDTDSLTPQADLAITKTDVNDLLFPGQAIDYTITVENLGPSNVTGAHVNDIFPAVIVSHDWLVTFATPGATATPNSGGVAADLDSFVDIPAGGVIVFTVHRVIDPAASPLPQTLVNTATVDSPIDTNPANNSSTHTDTILSVVPLVDLMIAKTHVPAVATPGQSVTYTITITNHGETDAASATAIDTFLGTPGFSAFTAMNWVVDLANTSAAANFTPSGSGPLNATFDLVVGGFITYTISGNLASSALGTIANRVEVFPPPGTTDPDADNVATDQVPLVPVVNVTVNKDDGVTTVVPGTAITYTVVVANTGPSDAPGVLVTDPFPTGQLTGITWTSTAAGGAMGNDPSGVGNISDFVDLPAGSSVTYTIHATVLSTALGTLVNTATADVPQNGIVDDTDTDTLTPVADLAVRKSSIPSVVTPGSLLTYRIVVRNLGPSAVSNFTLTEILPGRFAPLSFTPSRGSYDPATGLWSSVLLGSGQKVVLTVRGRVTGQGLGFLFNEATALPPQGITDPDLSNNTADDLVSLFVIPSKRLLLASHR